MNINEVNGYTHTKQPSSDRKAGGDKKFDRILNDAMDSVVHEERAGDDLFPVKGVDAPVLWDRGHVDHSILLQHAYHMLDLLEEYSEALNNPHMTLKRIEPIVARIAQGLKGLDMQSMDNVAQDDELAGIINDIAVTARVEAFKFQRGDYVA
ncbi:MAG: hypothetical protein JRJ42_00470 [Deltaproteobacteria bacterium]|nr:hypothetical protein [Deltaproteobacteria bacterium]MBW2018944.1 hypothetical protein [Deltaproteobacteria bacterium]MBW2073159.1 hypothetical protein [Deltaproteobacteria bacterium]RLB83778.1 MAG: hypothetical protein DRH17_01070 [Deltaproteobacteria bacterium]